MKYAYARVSTEDQNDDMQLTALKRTGCKVTFTDRLSGATGVKRPSLLRCLKKLEPGDTLMVWKLGRLGRSLRDLITMLDDVKQRGAGLVYRNAVVLIPEISKDFRQRMFLQAALSSNSTM